MFCLPQSCISPAAPQKAWWCCAEEFSWAVTRAAWTFRGKNPESSPNGHKEDNWLSGRITSWGMTRFLVPCSSGGLIKTDRKLSHELWRSAFFFETNGVLSGFSVIKTLPSNRLSSLESPGSHLWQSYTRDIRSPLRGAFTWIILTIAAMESAFLCTLRLGLKSGTCTQWVSDRTGRKPADTHLARKEFVRHGKGKCGAHRGGTWLESVSTSYSTHTHTNTLFLTLWIRVLQEPWGVLWSLLPCHLAAQRSLSIGTSQSSHLECYAFNFHPSIPIYLLSPLYLVAVSLEQRQVTSLTSRQFIIQTQTTIHAYPYGQLKIKCAILLLLRWFTWGRKGSP